METIGVIIPTKKRLNDWVKIWGNPEIKYIYLDNLEKCKGQRFTSILKAKDWYLVDSAEDILKEANSRIV